VQHNPPSRFLSEIDGQVQHDLSSFGFGFVQQDPVQSFTTVSDEPRYVPELNEGDVVRHQIFGQGTIVEMDGDTASIFFKGKGLKKLNTAFAPLEKL
jgi:hypothetical protein